MVFEQIIFQKNKKNVYKMPIKLYNKNDKICDACKHYASEGEIKVQTVSRKTKNDFKFKKLVLFAILLLIVVTALYFILTMANNSKLNYEKIYEGVYAGNQDVGGLTVKEAAKKIKETHKIDKERIITISCEGKEVNLSLSDMDIEVDALKSAQAAFDEGRKGTRKERLDRIKEIKKNKAYLHISFKYNEELLKTKVNELANQVDEPEREVLVELEGDEIIITRGKAGKRIVMENAKLLVEKAFMDSKSDKVELVKEDIVPPDVTVGYLKEQICTKPQDASYKIENNRLTIIEEKVGIEIDLDKAEIILKETPGDVVRIPVNTMQPKVTAQSIKDSLFPDLLGSYETRYNASNVSRSHNVALASEKISEIVLAPDEVFSYNDIVGPRTAERGFKEAGVYVGNKVEQGLGGGICQVSSTLFNAVVYADLNIVYRTNHSLPVSYVPLGRDATVSYGSIDFKFSNNTGAPIKIVASAQNGRNVVSIYGVKNNPEKTIEITTECTGTYSPKVEKIEDPLLPVGEIKVEEAGSNGSSYVTYKITKENGKTVKTEVLTKSRYSATDRVERVGTMEEVPTQSPSVEGGEVTDVQGTSPSVSDKPSEHAHPTASSEPAGVSASATMPSSAHGGQ